MPERHQLTALQLAILRVLWDRGEATVQDIWEALHAERGLAQTTVATMLSRLERRGVVTRRAPPESRQYHYRAAVTEREVQHSMVGELTERLFDVRITFGDGKTFSPTGRFSFTGKSRSRGIALPGAARTIRWINFFYRGNGTVHVYGRR